jgi:predicted nucleic acid-binding protein
MGFVLLDTTVLIDALRGRPAGRRVLALREVGDLPVTSAINVEEVVRGLRPPEMPAVESFFSGLPVIRLGRAEGERAGTWRRTFAQRGRTLSQADCLVAAAALSVQARLATGNPKDYPMAELTVEIWPVGA